VRVVEADEDAILAAVTPRTRLVAVSHVLWTTGRGLEVTRLREALHVPLLVDGAQSAGAVPVDATEADFYTVSAQKWPCGPESTGALYVADPEAMRVAAPTYMAQERHEPDGSFVPCAGAARFDSAQISPTALAGLCAALDVHPEWRFERAAEAARRCRELLSERFEVEPGEATLVAFRPEGEPAETVARLRERDVVVRDIPGRGIVRVSCGYWTSDGDLERLLDAL
jgi:L-cysteine/cystine lyase